MRPSVGPSTGATKVLQPSAAALKAAEKLLASVEAEEDEEETSVAAPAAAAASTHADMRPPQFVPPKPSTVSVAKEEAKKKTTPEELPLPTRPVSPVATAASSDFRLATAIKVATRPTGEESDPGTSKEIKPIAHETPVRKPASSFAISESPATVPKYLGMRSRPRGSLKAKFATPWKQGVQPPGQPPAMLQLHNPRIASSPQTPSTSKVIKTTNQKRIPRDANTVFDLSQCTNAEESS